MKEYFKNLYIGSNENFYKIIKKNVKNNKKTFVITANAETFMFAKKDKTMNEIILNKNNLVVADGISILMGAKKLKLEVPTKITGVEMMENLLINSKHNKVYLLGSKKEVLTKLVDKINSIYPNVSLVGYHDGYNYDETKVINKIIKTKPDFIFIALGIPKQEKLINKIIDKVNKGVFIGVGGSFDVISGVKKRAPKIIRKLNLEWLYRIIKEPKRIKRFYQNNIKFLIKIKGEKEWKD